MCVSRWLGVRLDLICAVFATGVCFVAVATASSLEPGTVGLSLSYVLQLTAMFQWCVRQSIEVENLMTSVERLDEYTNLPSEEAQVGILATAITPLSVSGPASILTAPSSKWPQSGSINLKEVYLRYSTESAWVLRGLTWFYISFYIL